MRIQRLGAIMKILITGHLGYIGTVLTPKLLERNYQLVGLDCDLFKRCTFTGQVEALELIGSEIRDFVQNPQAVERLEDIDAIIHLAALSNDPLGDYKPELTQSVNTDASISLAKLAKKAGVKKFIFASSCSNYGKSGEAFIDESGQLNPLTPYGHSKVNVERAVTELADDSFSPVFLRASTAYGVSPRLRFDIVVNNLTAWAFTTGQVNIKSDGTPWRPIVHVEDICQAYISVLEAPTHLVHKQAFNVGHTSENYQVKDIAEIVRQIVPNSELTIAQTATHDPRSYRVDCNHIAKTLHSFKPQWTCRRGVEQLLAAYDDKKITLDAFEGERYKRIAHVKKLMHDGIIDENLRVIAA